MMATPASVLDLHLRRWTVPADLPRKHGGFIDNWFSNMKRTSSNLWIFGNPYMGSEQAYVAAKSTSQSFRARVSGMDAGAAKRAGTSPTILRPHWDTMSLAAMWTILIEKWRPGTPEHEALIASRGPIVEWTNWGRSGRDGLHAACEQLGLQDDCLCSAHGDRIWGVGAARPDDGVGRNALGLMLMLLRNAGHKMRQGEGRWPRPVHNEALWPALQVKLIDTMNRIPGRRLENGVDHGIILVPSRRKPTVTPPAGAPPTSTPQAAAPTPA